MRVQIIQVLISKGEAIGYICKYNSGECLRVDREHLVRLMRDNPDLVINAKISNEAYGELDIYNKVPKLDLDTNKLIGDNTQYKSRKTRAEEYIYKSKIIGNNIMRFNIVSDEDVRLVSVDNKNSTGTLVIPSFITSFGKTGKIGANDSPFKDCKYTKIILDNDPNVMLDVSRLFSGMLSKTLYITVIHPKCINEADKLFSDCIKLEYLDISRLGIKVESLNGMFEWCIALKQIKGLSSICTSNVKSTQRMFKKCVKISEIDMSELKIDNIENIDEMFTGCRKLVYIDFSNINLSNLNSMVYTFANCELLTTVNFGDNKLESLTSMSSAFVCSGIQSLDFGNCDMKCLVNMSSTFEKCDKLVSVVLPKNTHKLNSIVNLFYQCHKLKHIDTTGFNIDNVDIAYKAFSECHSITEIDISKFRINKIDCNMMFMFSHCSRLKEIDLSQILPDFNGKKKAYERIVDNCIQIEKISLPRMYVGDIASFSNSFEYTRCVNTLDISGISFANNSDDAMLDLIDRLIVIMNDLKTLIVSKSHTGVLNNIQLIAKTSKLKIVVSNK